MNTNQHTVTIPIADYDELIEAINNSNIKFDQMRDVLVKDLESMRVQSSRHMTPNELLWQIISVIKDFK